MQQTAVSNIFARAVQGQFAFEHAHLRVIDGRDARATFN